MKTVFDEAWLDWIHTNVSNGQDKDGLFKILLDEGYAFDAIQQQLNHTPSLPIEQIVNPLRAQAQAQTQAQTSNTTLKQSNYGAPTDKSKIFIPNALQFKSNDLEIYKLGNLFTAQECEKIIESIRSKLRPSELSSKDSDASYRTSRTCDLGTLDDEFIHYVDSRICQLIGIDPEYSEVIQGQLYEPGQEFKAHTDYFEKNEMAEHAAITGQRTYTIMIYLNEVELGGETEFTHIGEKLTPEPGLAVIWNSLNPDGSPNPCSMHRAHPVLKGYKAVITKWFRSRNRSGANTTPSAMYCKTANEFIPNYTHSGLHLSKLDDALFEKIVAFYEQNRQASTPEHVPGNFIENASKHNPKSSSLIDLPDELRQAIHDEMQPLMAQWCGQELEPTYVYGIREYHRGAKLKMHRDRIDTHIISAIINVAQEVDEDWPLIIEDNAYRTYHVQLKPGEMVFYEGGRLLHGRPIPFNGDRFANIFCHFKPVGYTAPK